MVKRLTVILDDATHKKLKKKALEQDRDMSEMLREKIKEIVAS